MKKYLLDTGPLAAFLLGRARSLAVIDPWIASGEVATSIMVYGEVEEYIKQMENYAVLHAILVKQLEEIKPLTITREIMGIYADLRRQMRSPHGSGLLPDSDTLIAATALHYDLVLVTGDERDFRRVPGLKIMLLRGITSSTKRSYCPGATVAAILVAIRTRKTFKTRAALPLS